MPPSVRKGNIGNDFPMKIEENEVEIFHLQGGVRKVRTGCDWRIKKKRKKNPSFSSCDNSHSPDYSHLGDQTTGSNVAPRYKRQSIGELAQMVERPLSMREVPGSIPRFSMRELVFFHLVYNGRLRLITSSVLFQNEKEICTTCFPKRNFFKWWTSEQHCRNWNYNNFFYSRLTVADFIREIFQVGKIRLLINI